MFSLLGSLFGKGKKGKTRSKSSSLSPESQELLQAFQENEARYYTVRYLGEGGFGRVECCFDAYLHRATALKRLHPHYRNDEQQIQAIMNEVRLISYLDHPGVVSIYDAFLSPEGDFTYTMELLEGEDMDTRLERLDEKGELLPLAQAIKIFTKLFETLAYVHDKGVIHLDIKPSNIMLGKYGEVQILDWGTAHLYDPERYEEFLREYGKDAKAHEIIHDRSDRIEGTVPFMSPDQTECPRNQLTPASDIFSTGVVFYRALTGRYPFTYENLERFLHDLHQIDPPPLHELRGDVPLRLSQICGKMLHKDIEQRYQSFHEVLRDLEDLTNSGQLFQRRVFQPGEILLQEGEIGKQAFQLIDGLVEISVQVKGKKKVLASRGSGAIIGELALFTKEPRSATVMALLPTTIKLLDEEIVMDELEKLNPWVGHMIYQLSQRFVEQNQRILQLEDEKARLLGESTPPPPSRMKLPQPDQEAPTPPDEAIAALSSPSPPSQDSNPLHTADWGATPPPQTQLQAQPSDTAQATADWGAVPVPAETKLPKPKDSRWLRWGEDDV